MIRSRRLLWIPVAVAVVLTAALGLAWRSAAAPASQAPAPPLLAEVNPANAAAPQAPVPGGPSFQMVSAFQFKPRSMSTTWEYKNLDLHNPGSGTSIFDASFTLPNNVTITNMVLYFYDNSGYNVTAWLYRGDPTTGDWVMMASGASSGAQDAYRYISVSSIENSAVDQQSYSYLLTVEVPPAATSLRLTSVRIDYGHSVDLPLVLSNQ